MWFGAGWEVFWEREGQDWVWALPILEEHGEVGYVCVLVAVEWVVLGRVDGRLGPGSGRVGWCYVCVCCEYGISVLMAGPGICMLC